MTQQNKKAMMWSMEDFGWSFPPYEPVYSYYSRPDRPAPEDEEGLLERIAANPRIRKALLFGLIGSGLGLPLGYLFGGRRGLGYGALFGFPVGAALGAFSPVLWELLSGRESENE